MQRFYVKEDEKSYVQVNNPDTIYNMFKELQYADQETFWIVGLNNNNKVLLKECLFKGSVDRSIACHKLIFKRLLQSGSSNFFVVHNHPSGNETPSNDDTRTTIRIAKIANFMGFNFYDHIIIGNNKYYSYLRSNSECLRATIRE